MFEDVRWIGIRAPGKIVVGHTDEQKTLVSTENLESMFQGQGLCAVSPNADSLQEKV